MSLAESVLVANGFDARRSNFATGARGARDSVSFPARDASAGGSRRRIRERLNLRGGVSCRGASASALLLLLLTRFSRQLPLLACLLIVRLRHEVLVC